MKINTGIPRIYPVFQKKQYRGDYFFDGVDVRIRVIARKNFSIVLQFPVAEVSAVLILLEGKITIHLLNFIRPHQLSSVKIRLQFSGCSLCLSAHMGIKVTRLLTWAETMFLCRRMSSNHCNQALCSPFSTCSTSEDSKCETEFSVSCNTRVGVKPYL